MVGVEEVALDGWGHLLPHVHTYHAWKQLLITVTSAPRSGIPGSSSLDRN